MKSRLEYIRLFAPTIFILFVFPSLVGDGSANAQCNPIQLHKLLAADGASQGSFGTRAGISGNTSIIGARTMVGNSGTEFLGSAYLFDTTTGQQLVKLEPVDNSINDGFGASVGIDGTIAIVGSVRDDDNGTDSGSAYLFDTTTYQQLAKLLPNDGAPDDLFGGSVSISGTTVIISADRDDDNGEESGSAYLFDTTTGQQIAKLVANDGAARDFFGGSVSIIGTTVIIGARRDDDNGENSGSAYLFDVTTGQQIAKLLPDDGVAGDGFGRSVAISGNKAIVGAHGSAYLFDVMTGQQIVKLLPNDGAAGDEFGHNVGINGTIAIAGSITDNTNGTNSGSAYLFDTATGNQIAKLLADDGAAGDFFGGAISIDGSKVIVGANGDDDNGDSSGSAYLFEVVCNDVVNADSFLVTRGDYVSGGVVELAESDNLDLTIQRSNSDIQSRTEFEVKAVSPVASPSSLFVTLEGSVFARSQVDQTIELYDYVAGVWEQVDTRAATRFTDSTVTVAATGDLTRFVEAGTMSIEARIRYQSPVARQRFSSNTDQFVWTIGQ